MKTHFALRLLLKPKGKKQLQRNKQLPMRLNVKPQRHLESFWAAMPIKGSKSAADAYLGDCTGLLFLNILPVSRIFKLLIWSSENIVFSAAL